MLLRKRLPAFVFLRLLERLILVLHLFAENLLFGFFALQISLSPFCAVVVPLEEPLAPDLVEGSVVALVVGFLFSSLKMDASRHIRASV